MPVITSVSVVEVECSTDQVKSLQVSCITNVLVYCLIHTKCE